MLLQMKDGGIIEIFSDCECSSGCETCDWGSSYINEFTIKMITGTIEIKVENMYEYALSEGYMMQTILPNVELIKEITEQEFFNWIEENIREKFEKEVEKVEVNFNAK